jgi:uncharacterized protein (TIGR02391 family)
MSIRPLDAEELALLAEMVGADASASSQGSRDETFAIIRLNGGVHLLDHKGLGGRRPAVSQRAVLGLREAGLFRVVSETRSLLRVYLTSDAPAALETQSPNSDSSGNDLAERLANHLMQVVFDRFSETGEWPLVDQLRHELDQADDDLDVMETGRNLDPAFGSVGIGYQARAQLTIHGAARCSGSEQVLEDLLRTVRHPLRELRTYSFLGSIPGIGGGSGDPTGSWQREVTPDITRFKRVETIAGLLATIPLSGRLRTPEVLGQPFPGGMSMLSIEPTRTSGPELGNLHPRIVEVANALFVGGHYAQAAFEGLKAVEVRLRDLSALDLSGRDLAAQALGGDPPRIVVSRHSGRTGADEQEGFRLLAMGAMQCLRNPGGHELDPLDRQEALEQLAIASLISRWLDTSRVDDRQIVPSTRPKPKGRGHFPPAEAQLRPGYQRAAIRLVVLRELQDLGHRQTGTSQVLDLDLGTLAIHAEVDRDKVQDALVDLLGEGLAEPFGDSQGHSGTEGACRITGAGVRELAALEAGG